MSEAMVDFLGDDEENLVLSQISEQDATGRFIRFIGRNNKAFKCGLGDLWLDNKDIKHYARDMDIPNLSVESINVSKILAAHAFTLPVVKLRQEEAMYECNILKIFHAHHTDPILMPCGSRAEGLAMLTGRNHAYLSSSDEDVIIFANFVKVYETRSELRAFDLSNEMEYQVLRIPDAYPGYSTLVVSPHDNKLMQFCEFQDELCFLKHSVKEIIINNLIRQYQHTFHGPAVTIDLFSKTVPSLYQSEKRSSMKFAFKSKDFVFCLRGQSWPIEACEWTTRKRSSNWPSRELFDNIIKSGYLLAGVGQKESKESEIQWRVSFNSAEQLIIESFNETQIQCLILLRFLKGSRLSKLAGKNITSFTMKTVMFWSLDEIKNECWQPHNLLYCFCFCLNKLKLFVEEKFLPDYFIRKRNHFILSEFTHDEQTHTRQFLISFLDNPKENINILLSSYNLNNMHKCFSDSLLQVISQEMFIKSWLCIRISMAEGYHNLMDHSFCNLYEGYNIENILLRCNDVFEKLTIINYAQPFIKLLQSCMGVLQYTLLRKEREVYGNIADSDKRRQSLEYMKLSLGADLTHTALRVATCLLDDGVEERDHCIALIWSVTDHPNSDLYKKAYSDVLRENLENPKIQAFEKLQPICEEREIPIYNKIINQDLMDQDPYRTIEQFKLFKEQGYQVRWHSNFLLVWDWCWFNVIFMSAELPVLPKPAALELCINDSQKKISFHPFLYGLLLEFLWHAKYSQTKEEAGIVLEKMKSSFETIPHQQQSSALNFITYCFTLYNDYRSAARYLIRSFNFNPVSKNVAYLYIMYIIKLLGLTSSDNVDDRSLWLNLHEIKWNID